MTVSRRFPQLCLLLLLFAGLFGSDKAHAFMPAKGMFLVAKEQLADPRFRDRIILLIQHDSQGSAGLVINRPSRLLLATMLPKGSRMAGQGHTLSYGGPVEPQALLALVKVRNHPPEPADEIIDNLYITGVGVLDEWPDFAEEVVDYRAFVGYTGWTAGQLDAEIQRGDWLLLPADEQSVLAEEGVPLWERLHARALQNH
ncbi:MAG: YqgE/AlgH family protein [Desulfuromonadales bacterium]